MYMYGSCFAVHPASFLFSFECLCHRLSQHFIGAWVEEGPRGYWCRPSILPCRRACRSALLHCKTCLLHSAISAWERAVG